MRYVLHRDFLNDFIDAIRTNTQAAFKRRYRELRRPARRRHPVHRGQGALPGGVLPHLQRPPRRRPPDRALLRPPARGHRHPRGPAAQPVRVGPDHRHPAARPRDPPGHPAQEGRAASHADAPTRCSSYIASHITDNIRELEGALTGSPAFASLNHEPLTLTLAEERPGRPASPPTQPRQITPQVVLEATAEHVRPHRRGPLRQEPQPAPRHRPPDRHVRLPGDDRLSAIPPSAGRSAAATTPRSCTRSSKIADAHGGAAHDLRPGHRAHDRVRSAGGRQCRDTRWTTRWTGRRALVTRAVVHQRVRARSSHPCGRLGTSGDSATAPDLRRCPSSTIHSPYYYSLILLKQ